MSYGKCNFIRNWHIVSQSSCKFLHPNQQYRKIPVALHLHPQLICQVLNFSHYRGCVVISHYGGQVLFMHETQSCSFSLVYFIVMSFWNQFNIGLKQCVGKHIPFSISWNCLHKFSNIYFLIVWWKSEWSHLDLEFSLWECF